MWVRSQTKEGLIECNGFIYSERNIYPNKIQCCIYANGVLVGKYSTKEKAIKVLDMIQNRILSKDYSTTGIGYPIIKDKVFQMPQDSEV